MIKWEYSHLAYHSNTLMYDDEENNDESQRLDYLVYGKPDGLRQIEGDRTNLEAMLGDYIRDLGLEGWELVNVVRAANDMGPNQSWTLLKLSVFYYFKRQIQ